MPEIDIVGIDAYMKKEEAPRMERTVLHLASTSQLPFIPEFGAGIWCTGLSGPPMLLEDDLAFQSLYAVMKGVKAVNFYMLVDRDRWAGGPITNDGRIRKAQFDTLWRFNRIMQARNLYTYRREPKDLILVSWAYEQYRNAAVPIDLHKFGPLRLPEELFESQALRGLAAPAAVQTWLDAVIGILKQRKLPFDMGDTQLPLSRLIHYDRIYLASGGLLHRDGSVKLASYWKNGGKLFIGPKPPAFDETARPAKDFAWMSEHGATPMKVRGSLGRVSGPADFLTMDKSPCEIEVHHGPKKRKAVYLANPSDRPVRTTLEFSGAVLWEDLTADSKKPRKKGRRLRVSLPPYSVKVYHISPAGREGGRS
jgi:beta-galactosidase